RDRRRQALRRGRPRLRAALRRRVRAARAEARPAAAATRCERRLCPHAAGAPGLRPCAAAPAGRWRHPPLDSPAMTDLGRLVAAMDAVDVVGSASVEVTELAYATDAVAPGVLFFFVRGAHADGHDFAAAAVERGAAALVVERPLELPVPQVVVPDSRVAMAPAAAAFFGEPTHELQVVGVTGTNGKTTTTFLLYAILAAAGRRPGLVGTIEARVGGERRGI